MINISRAIEVANFTDIGSPIKEFIEKTRKEAQAGLGDWELKAPIELELSAVVSGNIGGGFDIQVLKAGAKVEAEHVQKIKLSVGPKDDVTEAEERLKIIKANAEEQVLREHPELVIRKYA